MRVTQISDLHLEFSDLTLPGGDVLILGGDILEAKNLKRDMYDPNMVMMPDERADRRPDRFYRFIEEECSRKYREVIYIMGNHEHYRMQFHKTGAHILDQLPDNVHLLENESRTIDDVTFVGATLWTDCNSGDPMTEHHLRFNMSDYRAITMLDPVRNIYHKLTPEYTARQHRKSLEYIRAVVENNPDKKYVVATHHAPSRLSTHPVYQHDTLMNGGYSSNLDDFIISHPQIQFWTHGHTHDPFDYMIGTTRVLCNPRGYFGYEAVADAFDATVGFDI